MKSLFIALCFLTRLASAETKEIDAKGLKTLYVGNGSGSITITTTTGKAVVTANIVSGKCDISIEVVKNTLEVKSQKNKDLFDNDNCNVEFTIKVPKTIDLNIHSGTAAVQIDGIEGALVFKTGTAPLNATGTFKSIEGASGTGATNITGLTGGGILKSGTGDVALSFAKAVTNGELELKSGTGDITLSFVKGTKVAVNFKSGTGSLKDELGLTASAGFKVTGKSGTGKMVVKSY